MATKFRKNDKVKVIYGKDKGKITKILKFFPKSDKVLLSGIGIVKKHTKPTKNNPEGGILKKEKPIHISNIMCINFKKKFVSKIGFRLLKQGKKVRFLKKSNEIIENKEN